MDYVHYQSSRNSRLPRIECNLRVQVSGTTYQNEIKKWFNNRAPQPNQWVLIGVAQTMRFLDSPGGPEVSELGCMEGR